MPFENADDGNDGCILKISKIIVAKMRGGKCCGNGKNAAPQICPEEKWNMQKIETGIKVLIYNIRLLIRYRIRTEMELLD